MSEIEVSYWGLSLFVVCEVVAVNHVVLEMCWEVGLSSSNDTGMVYGSLYSFGWN